MFVDFSINYFVTVVAVLYDGCTPHIGDREETTRGWNKRLTAEWLRIETRIEWQQHPCGGHGAAPATRPTGGRSSRQRGPIQTSHRRDGELGIRLPGLLRKVACCWMRNYLSLYSFKWIVYAFKFVSVTVSLSIFSQLDVVNATVVSLSRSYRPVRLLPIRCYIVNQMAETALLYGGRIK